MIISGWGNFPKINSQQVFPCNSEELIKIIKKFNSSCIARGMGRSYGDSSLALNSINLSKYNKIISFDSNSGLLVCESGATINQIIKYILEKGWFFPVIPGTKYVSIGGAISSDVHGKNHHQDGCISSFIKKITFIDPNYKLIECSKYLNPEYFKAICGGMGLIGIITQVEIQLIKIPSAYINEEIVECNNISELFENFEKNNNALYSVAWIDFFSFNKKNFKSIFMKGNFNKIKNYKNINDLKINVPFYMPSNLLNNKTISIYNKYNYYRSSKNPQKKLHLDKFFFPLDKIGNWNKIYGKNGFIQYQFVIPKTKGHEGLEEIFNLINSSKSKPFLSVLKLFGDENDNYLSFPKKGWTLALDFKNNRETVNLINKLDQIILKFKGKIYLAKDSLMSEKLFKSTYDSWEKFYNFRVSIGADKVFNSVQSKRLGI